MAQMKIIVFLELCCGRKNVSFVTHGVAIVPAIRPQWGRLSASRIDASRLCRIAFTFRFCIAWAKLWRPPAAPAAHRPLGGGRDAGSFGRRGDCCIVGVFGILVFR